MMNARTLAICGVGVMLLAGRLDAQDLSRYRTFELGSELLSVSTLTGVASSEAKTVHLRPALLQDLEWRPSRWGVGSASPSTDPVEQIVFSFYNNQLFRIIVDYGQERTKGLTDADMIDSRYPGAEGDDTGRATRRPGGPGPGDRQAEEGTRRRTRRR